jgi:hypothetical protein
MRIFFDPYRHSLFIPLKETVFRYKLYEDATVSALIDRYGDGSGHTCVQPQDTPVVMVVGAGRGPIVRAALQVEHSMFSFSPSTLFIAVFTSLIYFRPRADVAFQFAYLHWTRTQTQ